MTRYEQETIITYNEAEEIAGVYTHNKALRNKLEKLAQEHPEQCRLERVSMGGRAVDYIIPKAWVKIRPPLKLSEAERERRRERGRKASFGRDTREIYHVPAIEDVSEGNYTPGEEQAHEAR